METRNETAVASKKRKLSGDNTSSTTATNNSGEKTVVDCIDTVKRNNQLEEQKAAPPESATDLTFNSFNGFKVKNILSNSADCKRVIVEALVDGGKSAVIVLDKKPFTDQVLEEFFSDRSQLKHTFQNDIYGSYDCHPVHSASEIKATVVYPATQKHIDKYIVRPLYLIDETPLVYEKVTLPYLESSTFNIQWVFNILEHKKEAERILFEDPSPDTGFILLPDLKWDGVALENLYLVAIIHQKGLKSLRDLNSEHLPLLENVLTAGSKAISQKYGLKRSQLRIYLHYQPSYYHLHIHFTSLRFNAPGIFAGKSHLLQSVIANIKNNSSYYQQATLPFVVKEDDQLFSSLSKYGYQF